MAALNAIGTAGVLSVRLVTPPDRIRRGIAKALQPKLQRMLGSQALQNDVKRGVRNVVERRLEANMTILALQNADARGLTGELGTTEGPRAASQIINAVKKTVQTRTTPVMRLGDQLKFKFMVTAAPSDMQEVLDIPAGMYDTEKGQTIDWITWLIALGNEIIIRDFDAVMAHPKMRSYSRTGLLVMKRDERGWRVPPEHAGSFDDNFITRAIDGAAVEAANILQAEVTRRIR